MSEDYLSPEEVDRLLKSVTGEDEWAAAMSEQKNIDAFNCPTDKLSLHEFSRLSGDEILAYNMGLLPQWRIKQIKGMNNMFEDIVISDDKSNATFSIRCGDWLYPSKDSGCRTKYNTVNFPLVLALFPTTPLNANKENGDIALHLNSSRRLHCGIDFITRQLRLISLTNDEEPEFELILEDNSYVFDPCTLERVEARRLSADSFKNNNDWQHLSILVTSILLQDYLRYSSTNYEPGETIKEWGISNKLYFREATIPEIESIGKW